MYRSDLTTYIESLKNDKEFQSKLMKLVDPSLLEEMKEFAGIIKKNDKETTRKEENDGILPFYMGKKTS